MGQTASRLDSVVIAAPLAAKFKLGIEALSDPLIDAPGPQPTVRLRSDRARE